MIMKPGEEFFETGVQDEPRMKRKHIKALIRQTLSAYDIGYRVWITNDPLNYGVNGFMTPRYKLTLMENALRNGIYSAINHKYHYIKISDGCRRYTEEVLVPLFLHEAAHIVLNHRDVDLSHAYLNHKCEFEADDFAANETRARTGKVTVANLGLLLHAYHTPNWLAWSTTHPSSLARYRRQAKRWDLPTVEELENIYEIAR